VIALQAAQNLDVNSGNLDQNIQRLSSGLQINSAADNPAGFVIAQSESAQIAGQTQATNNTNDAINEVKTADSALNEVNSLLVNIRQTILDAANVGANDTTALSADAQEVSQAVQSIDRIASTTQFNNKNLLDGSAATTPLIFQVGANHGQTVSVSISATTSGSIGAVGSYHLSDLTAGGSINLTDSTGVAQQTALQVVDQAIADISAIQANLGSIQTNELQTNVSSLAVAQQNTEASQSSIQDTNFSTEIVNFTKNQILVQAGTSALAQANQAPQAILKLLQ
jgi:flagellin